MTSPSLAHSAARGALFTLTAQASRILLQLLSVVVLSRILSPHDYGLLAIVIVVVGLGEIFRDFGLTSASIQAPTLSPGQRDNLFWINTAIGAALSVLLFFASWPIAAVTNEPEIVGMTHWLSLTFLLNGMATQHRANLMRDLRLRAVAIVDVASAAIALLVAIAAAIAGAEFWALVAQQLTSCAVVLIGVVAFGHWLPRGYDRTESIRSMVTFGWNLVAANLVSYAARQIDSVLITFRFGTTALGLYNRSMQLISTPLGQVRGPLQSVALPVLARVQNDQPRFATYVTSAQLALGYLVGIPVALIAGLAQPVVSIMLGSDWAEATPIIRMFAISGILTTLAYVGYWVYQARGLGRQLVRYTLVTAGIKIVCISIGSFFGLVGVAVAYAVHPAIAWPISLAWLSRITPMPRRQLYQGAGRIIAVTALAGLAAWAITPFVGDSSWVQLAAGTATGLVAAATALIVPVYRRDAASLLAFMRLMLKRQRPAG